MSHEELPAHNPTEFYNDQQVFGEQVSGVAGEQVVVSDVMLTTQEALIHQLTEGEAGKLARSRIAAGKAVAVFIRDSRKVGLYIADRPEQIVGVATAIAAVAGVILFHDEIGQGIKKTVNKVKNNHE